jgi:hypothetical protein
MLFAPVALRASVPALVTDGVVTEVLAESVVNAPVVGVVAPTVPLMLIDAVPVRLVTVPDEGVPRAGVTSVGLLANTSAPVPVSSVTAAARLAEEGVPRNVATPAPSEVIPVPPFDGANVPPNVTAPVVAVFGVNPVVPALKDATVPAVVASVPVVGNVTFVVPVVVRVRE